jgi:spermidine/putrescine transport system permease protein
VAKAAAIAGSTDPPLSRERRPELIGVGSLLGTGILLTAIAARWVSGVAAVGALAVVAGAIVTLVMVALTGSPDTKRKLAPYGLLKPGMLWLALFYLAPLVTLFRLSLSTLPSRFAVEAEFDFNFGNFTRAFTDFGPQFTRAFIYAGTATILTILIGYPLAYVIAFRGGRYRTMLLGIVVIPFFTSFLIRAIAWRSLLADTGQVVQLVEAFKLSGLFETLGIMNNGRILNTPAAVIGGLTYNFLPFMVLPIYVSLEKVDPRLVDAAKDLYSTSISAFRKVVLP